MVHINVIPGLCCGAEIVKPLVDRLASRLGQEFSATIVDKGPSGQPTTRAYLDSIKKQCAADPNSVWIGYSLGGQLLGQLMKEGYAKNGVFLSTSMPSDWLQTDRTRLSIFARQLLPFAPPFLFSKEVLDEYILSGVPDHIKLSLLRTFHPEPASLIREYGYALKIFGYALGGHDTFLHDEGFEKIRRNCRGLFITGIHDRICPTRLQAEFAQKLGFRQVLLDSAHAPHLDINADQTADHISGFIRRLWAEGEISAPGYDVIRYQQGA